MHTSAGIVIALLHYIVHKVYQLHPFSSFLRRKPSYKKTSFYRTISKLYKLLIVR